MYINLNTYLPILIYILLCVLLVLLIIIAVKVINTMNKVEEIVDEVDSKVKSLNGAFGIVDKLTDKLSLITETVSDSILVLIKSMVGKIKNRKGRKEIKDEEE